MKLFINNGKLTIEILRGDIDFLDGEYDLNLRPEKKVVTKQADLGGCLINNELFVSSKVPCASRNVKITYEIEE